MLQNGWFEILQRLFFSLEEATDLDALNSFGVILFKKNKKKKQKKTTTKKKCQQ